MCPAKMGLEVTPYTNELIIIIITCIVIIITVIIIIVISAVKVKEI